MVNIIQMMITTTLIMLYEIRTFIVIKSVSFLFFIAFKSDNSIHITERLLIPLQKIW